MFERGVLGLVVLLAASFGSLVGTTASKRMVETERAAVATSRASTPRRTPATHTEDVVAAEDPSDAFETESVSGTWWGSALLSKARTLLGGPLPRRLVWTATTVSVLLVPVAYVHAWWNGQQDEYWRFQSALVGKSWTALLGMPAGMASFATGLPALAVAAYEDPSLILQIGEGMVAQTLEAAYTFATTADDEEAANAVASIVADAWFGKLLALGTIGTRVAMKSRWAANAASGLADARAAVLRPARSIHSWLPNGSRHVRTAKAGGFCFVAGTRVHVIGDVLPIEQIALGMRVATPEGETETETMVDASWKRIDLVMPDTRSANGLVRISLLRPPKWIERTRAEVGGDIELVLDEMDVRGRAHVLAIAPAPPIQEGAGRVVLATIRSESTDVRVLRFAETDEKLEPTARHPLYSRDRNTFVPARELRVGERLRTRTGALTVASVERKAGAHEVYNLEVESAHTYLVSRSALLTHNVDPCAEPTPSSKISREHPAVPRNVWSDEIRDRIVDAFKREFREVDPVRGPVGIGEHLGVTYATVYRHLRPSYRGMPSSQLVLRVARVYDRSFDGLVGRPVTNLRIEPRRPYSGTRLTRELGEQLEAETVAEFKVRYLALAMRSNMTADELAAKIGRTWETARAHTHPDVQDMPSLETLWSLADVEKAPMDWLVALTDDAPPGVTPEILAQARRSIAEGAQAQMPRVPTRAREIRAEIAPAVHERVGLLARNVGSSPAAVARSAGLNSTYFSQLGADPNRLPRTRVFLKIAQTYNASPGWLAGERKEPALPPRSVLSRSYAAGSNGAPTVEEVFRTRLAEAFARTGLTWKELADEIGIGANHLSDYVSPNANRLPSLENLVAIARCTGRSVDDFFSLDPIAP